MAVAHAVAKYTHLLQSFTVYTFAFLLVSCSSTKLAPRLADEGPTAIAVDSLVTPDPAVQVFIAPYKEKLDARLDSIVGYAAYPLAKQEIESGIGNFVADLSQEAAQELSPVPVDMGVVTIGGLRIPLPAGPIRLRDLYELMPFENRIVILELTGEQTRALFEFAAERGIVAISNSQMQVRERKPAQILINGKPFDPTKHYTVATSDYLAGGGDNMAFFREAKRLQQTDLLLRTAIINKVADLQQQGKKVDARIEGRIIILE